jgi:DNA repair protein RadC
MGSVLPQRAEDFLILILERKSQNHPSYHRPTASFQKFTGDKNAENISRSLCALNAAASGIILAHNQPSGSLQASQADMDLTKKLREGGRLLDVQVLDHIIMTSEDYCSFADERYCSSFFNF